MGTPIVTIQSAAKDQSYLLTSLCNFEAICNKSGALAMHEYPERPSVVALGTTKAVELAEMLVELSIQKHTERAQLKRAAAEAKASQPKFDNEA